MSHTLSCRAGVVYLLDACQTIGQMPIDVQALGCHFLTATGRKYLRAPRGSGFLYASPVALKDKRLEPSALDVRGGRWTAPGEYTPERSARRYEEYEMSFAAKARPLTPAPCWERRAGEPLQDCCCRVACL